MTPATTAPSKTGKASHAPRYRFDHIGITVPDLEAAIAFFAEHFDAEVKFRLDRFIDESGAATQRLGAPPHASFALAMLRLGDSEVELLQWWPAHSGSDTPNTHGAAHLAVSVADVDVSYAQLCAVPGVVALGTPVRFSGEPTNGLANAFIATPWGLLIELMEWPDHPHGS